MQAVISSQKVGGTNLRRFGWFVDLA